MIEPKDAGDMVIKAFETANYRWIWQINKIPFCKHCERKVEKLLQQMYEKPGEGVPGRA